MSIPPVNGDRAEDYFYIMRENCHKQYYSRITGRKVSDYDVSTLPHNLIDKIKSRDNNLLLVEKLDTQRTLARRINQQVQDEESAEKRRTLLDKLQHVRGLIKQISEALSTEDLGRIRSHDRIRRSRRQRRREEYCNLRTEMIRQMSSRLDNLSRDYQEAHESKCRSRAEARSKRYWYKRDQDFYRKHTAKSSSSYVFEARSERLLIRHRITNKQEWHRWLLVNHPDKGGDTNLCAMIISAGRTMGW